MNKKNANLDLEEALKTFNINDLFDNWEHGNLPVKIPASGNFPAEQNQAESFQVGIQSINIQSDRFIEIDGKKIEIPLGTKGNLTVGAIKKLAGSYKGALSMKRDGGSFVRAYDDDIIAIPKNGGKVEIQIVPSFQTE